MDTDRHSEDTELPKRPRSLRVVGGLLALVLVGGGLLVAQDQSSRAPVSPPDDRQLVDSAQVPVTFGAPAVEMDNPKQDGWDSEVLHQKIDQQLKMLGKWASVKEADRPPIQRWVAPRFSCGALIPERLETVFEDRALKVERRPDLESADSTTYRGLKGLKTALGQLSRTFQGASNLNVKFKVFRITKEGGLISTREYLAIAGHVPSGFVEINATWRTVWAPGSAEEPVKLVSIAVEEFERVTSSNPGGTLFADCTESILRQNDSYEKQILRGLNYWLERIQDTRYYNLPGTPGIALGDVNGDGLDDLYLCQEGGLPNRLFVQNPDATMRDVSEESGANWLESSRSALLLDLDNDGDQDLVVSTFGNLIVAENDGAARFNIRSILPTEYDTMSLCSADFDQDSDLDIYLCVYNHSDLTEDSSVLTTGGGRPFVYHDANNGGRNVLFQNDITRGGNWKFADVTEAVGLDTNNRRFSLAAAWEDFDNDGDQDLYVANDSGRNTLYRNDGLKAKGPRFVDIAAQARAEDSASGMSVAWGDYDRNGTMDIYVANMFSGAGSRITFQEQFKADAPPGVKQRLQRFARGNTLLKNLGDGTFEDTSVESAVTLGRWAWSSHFVDINLDGWEDLIVANGYITNEDTRDL